MAHEVEYGPIFLSNRVKRIQRFWRACVPLSKLVRNLAEFDLNIEGLKEIG